ncbi:hypothetical protein N7532_007068 [Penicillium argentinense]|uniref:NAD(P)-binding domain-containing protein n=1 Tax=Penicillium argentinense TaxID=1131581 RepID=A0A9W9KCK4_9EURO|nr:uncharacterized protein N7532_007068 [Penicillium argentinense]KAJ5100067.1 hypothetical protein N7532_007068 [Penicillium argentinense]
MKVFVVGATGAIGRYAVQALVDAGHSVTAVARTPEKASRLQNQGASTTTVSIYDRMALIKQIEGHQAVVNLATAIPPVSKFMQSSAWVENDRVRKEGSATIVDAAISAGAERIVQESVSMLYADQGDAWIHENSPTDDFPMAHGNLAAEASTHRFIKTGGTGVILRFGWFYGPGAKHSEEFFRLARNHIAIMMGPPNGYVSSIHVADAGAAVAAALAVPSGTYNVVDDEPLTKRAYADALSTAAGRPAWLRLPGRAALLLGNRSTSLTRSTRVSNAKLREESGWLPSFSSARDGWLATAKILRK